METLRIGKINKAVKGKIQLTGSKSESNRLLVLQQFYPNLKIENLSNSDDSIVMQQAFENTTGIIDIGHAGTAMRFLTAYFSVKEDSVIVITGSHRMQNRPVSVLVEALRDLGAEIDYLEKEGYPPLRITGKKLIKNVVEIEGNISSQYISALLLIAPTLQNGLKLRFKGEITSIPYIKMTLGLLKELGIEYRWEDAVITVKTKSKIEEHTVVVESDWSSASYYFSMVALSPNAEITISSFCKNSLQGDAVLTEIYKKLGVETFFESNAVLLKNIKTIGKIRLTLDLKSAPDIAQTIAVTCFGLGVECFLSGLHTLKIKETDRLIALKNEIEKLGGNVVVTTDTLHLKPTIEIYENKRIATYNDHRMAMAFAPLALRVPIEIEEAKVVSKSYPDFWKDFKEMTS